MLTSSVCCRWGEQARDLATKYQNLTGDILIASGEVAYLGAFTSSFRHDQILHWVRGIRVRAIIGFSCTLVCPAAL